MKVFLAIIKSPYTVAKWSVKGSIRGVKGAMAIQHGVRNWGKKEKGSYGDAAFAEEKKLAKLGHFENKGFLACVTRRGKPVFTHPERTALIIAPPGIGKSQHFIAHIHAVMERPFERIPHFVIGDAMGELWRNTRDALEAKGVRCIRLDMRNPDEWTKYDILSHLDSDWRKRFQYGEKLGALCELLVPKDADSRNSHFVDFPRLLLKCVITVNVKYEGNSKPLGSLISELISPEKRAALIERAKVYEDEFITATLETMAKMDGKPEGISMMSSSLRKLEGWHDEALRELTNYGRDEEGFYTRGWTFRDLFSADQPTAVFVVNGGSKAGADFARVAFGNAINALSDMYQDTSGPPKRDVEFIIDEAGWLGYCEAVSSAYARYRKAGARLRLCFLSSDELKKTYPDWETIWAGSDTLAFGGTNDLFFLQKVSQLAGEYTVHSKSLSESDKGSSRGRSEHPRRLVKEDEIRAKDDGEVLVLLKNMVVDGLKPWRIGKDGPDYLVRERPFLLKRLFQFGK
jgi:type IV secretion system protein VirD4